MAEETLDRRILREIGARLKELRATVEEYERLQTALSALETAGGEAQAPARAPRAKAATLKKRAPRGANREKALQVMADRPGVTVAELASATGIAKGVLYSLTRTLTQQAQIERVDLPGDTFGFRLATSTDDSSGVERDSDGATAEPAPTPRRARRRRKPAAETTDSDAADESAPEEAPATT